MKIINLILTLAVIGVGYLLFKTINEPIQFNKAKEQREDLIHDKLLYIRDVQMAYKEINNKFCATFDSLAMFVKNDSLLVTKVIGDPDKVDSKVRYITTKIPVSDSLSHAIFKVENLAKIPNVEGEEFLLETATLDKGRIIVPLFQVSTTFPKAFKGLNKKYIDPNGIIKVGSLFEPNYNGNWQGK